MSTIQNYLYDFILENAEFFNEYDRSNFVSSANLALGNIADLNLSIKAQTYSTMLSKSIAHINEIEIESYAVSEFITKILNSGRIESAKLMMRDITKSDKIIIKPQYLTDAIDVFRTNINNIASGKATDSDIKSTYIYLDKYIDTLKKRIVSSNININITPKEMVKNDFPDMVNVTTKYLEDIVIPFLQDVPKKKKELTNELSIVSSVVNSSINDLSKLVEDINIGMSSSDMLDMDKKKLMMNYTYNTVRGIMDTISFVTYVVLHKIHQFEIAVIECQNIYNKLVLIFNDNMTLIESGLLDSNIVSTDIDKMADDLSEGKNDIFEELAPQIIRYHQGYLSTHISPDSEPDSSEIREYMNNILDEHQYNSEPYTNIVKAYIEIGNGLDIIAKNSDDQFIVIDDVLEKSGFVLSLADRFHNELEAIDDMNQYSITDIDVGAGNEKSAVYYTILSEINDYPKVTKQIAEASVVIQKKVNYVRDILNTRTTDKLATSETLNELRYFIDTFEDQLKDFGTSIVKGLYNRLKALAEKADACIDNINDKFEDDYYINQNDFFGEAVLASLDEMNDINDIVMEALLKEYYSEREFKERGVRLVYEANAAVTITDNSAETGKTPAAANAKIDKTKLGGILNSIGQWFDKMISYFTDVINRQKAKNTKWLAEHKDGLISRSYSNVEIQILPYENMQPQNITNDINKLTTNVRNMNIQNLRSIASYEALRSKLINFGPKFTNDDDKVTITNYYKVGNNAAQPVTYANNNIKTQIINNMIPYCETFYDSYNEEVKKQLNNLKTALAEISKTYVNESVNELTDISFVTEAKAAAQPQATQTAQTQPQVQTQTTTTTTNQTITQTQNTKTAKIAEKAGWVKRCVQVYSGSVLNAIRDRNNDYLKVLFALAPKQAPVKEAQPQQAQQQNNQQAAQ